VNDTEYRRRRRRRRRSKEEHTHRKKSLIEQWQTCYVYFVYYEEKIKDDDACGR
jgi:hypothetical protein